MARGNSQEERIVDRMQQLGFTASEARAYVALLKKHPATGYEVAADSEVPRSAVYNVLRRLEALGLVNTIQAKPARYVPLDPDSLSELLTSRFSSTVSSLKEGLDALDVGMAPTTTWTIRGYEAMLEQAQGIVRNARRSLYLSVWGREARHLADPLRNAVAEGLQVVVFSFTPLPEDLGKVFSYGIDEDELSRYWSNKIILIADYRDALIGGAEESQDNRAVVTSESSLMEIAVSNLVLDITLYGQRFTQDVSDVVAGLSLHLAPIDDLLAKTRK